MPSCSQFSNRVPPSEFVINETFLPALPCPRSLYFPGINKPSKTFASGGSLRLSISWQWASIKRRAALAPGRCYPPGLFAIPQKYSPDNYKDNDKPRHNNKPSTLDKIMYIFSEIELPKASHLLIFTQPQRQVFVSKFERDVKIV